MFALIQQLVELVLVLCQSPLQTLYREWKRMTHKEILEKWACNWSDTSREGLGEESE